MLYDRLARDLYDAAAAIGSRDLAQANQLLQHAQEIVSVLDQALDIEVWPAGQGLAQIYEFLIRHLMTANLKKSAANVEECLSLVEPLAEAWREAYDSAGSVLNLQR